ncbi:hypothetical protein EJ08DRAFT_733698 [Tothia fuscella]|uniref:Uncharacterized protein n=1 Tax=Tothia fuscella TaxID=1048955 RepID=A0A9P4NT25_9PEZI|nr:hypothetical protein EJ08DRAFT_733698 [Tothia fuscella]
MPTEIGERTLNSIDQLITPYQPSITSKFWPRTHAKMKLSLLFVSLLSAFALAHGPDDDGDELPKGVAPKADVPPKGSLPGPAVPAAKLPGLPKAPVAPAKAPVPPKAPKGAPKAAGGGHSHGGM